MRDARKTSVRWRSLVVLALVVAIGVGLTVQAQPLPRNETVYKAGMQWGPPPGFNPMMTGDRWPVTYGVSDGHMIYEPLFAYNLLTGDLDPVLARSIEWIDDLTAHVTLFDGTRWQDGIALTVEDVVYTYDLGRRYDVPFSPVWDYLESIEALDERTVVFKVDPDRPHRAMVLHQLTQVRIVPQHVWEILELDVDTITEVPNWEPVGSGPYTLLRHSPEQVAVVRFDDYWGSRVHGVPAPRYIVHPIFRSNDAGNLALERGQVDWSQQFVPEIWRMWEDRGLPVGTWFAEEPYFLPAGIPSLFINLQRDGLSDPLVRRALAFAIDYPSIAETAMSRYSPVAQSSMIVPVGVAEQVFFNEEDVAEYGWRFDPEEAVRILEEELGASKGNDGIYVLPDGTRLGPWVAHCPYGWTDWMTALEIVSESARAIGIDVRTEFPEAPVSHDRRETGNFDLTLWTPEGGQSPAHPWIRFHHVMDNRGVADIGGLAFRNWNRYQDDEAEELLDRAALTEDEAELAEIYRQLDRIFMRDIPMIGLMYRPWQFYSFNETYWTNFPTEDNAYAPPLHGHTGMQIYLNLEPVNP